MPGPFSDLQLKRIAVHEVFERPLDGEMIPPRCSTEIAVLAGHGLVALRDRLVKALSSEARSVQMAVAQHGPGSTFELFRGLIGSDNPGFLAGSVAIATKLSHAQVARSIPGGIVLVIDGVVGMPVERPFSAIIKAELTAGFRRQLDAAGGPGIEFINDVLLTKDQKFHKLGMFVRDGAPAEDSGPEDFSVYVFDSEMGGSDIDKAARYFHDTFLGCVVAPTAPRQTRDFYFHTKSFIETSTLNDERKVECMTALNSYLRSERRIISPAEFARDEFPDEIQQAYADHLAGLDLPPAGIQKDTKLIKQKLRMRRVNFNTEVRIIAPADKFAELVHMSGEQDGITVVRIRGTVTSQN